MKNILILALLFSSLTLFTSCCDDDETPAEYFCVFEQNDADMDGIIDETERSIMTECDENAFESKSEIEDNLIGEWKLIGHGEGWIPTISQPCGYATFTKEELTFQYNDGIIDTTYIRTWEIEVFDSSNFRLKINPSGVIGLNITKFSSKYFYGDYTPVDGNMYLYEKVK